MSGHSKWATTKRAKAIVDAKRSNLFTKLSNNITIAAKEGGGDPATNFKLPPVSFTSLPKVASPHTPKPPSTVKLLSNLVAPLTVSVSPTRTAPSR